MVDNLSVPFLLSKIRMLSSSNSEWIQTAEMEVHAFALGGRSSSMYPIRSSGLVQ